MSYLYTTELLPSLILTTQIIINKSEIIQIPPPPNFLTVSCYHKSTFFVCFFFTLLSLQISLLTRTHSLLSPSINSLPCWSLRSSLPVGGCCRPDGCKGCSPQTLGWKAFADGRQMRQNTNEKWLTNKRRKRDKQK